jgi:polysaccharide biosynthesis/export protein
MTTWLRTLLAVLITTGGLVTAAEAQRPAAPGASAPTAPRGAQAPQQAQAPATAAKTAPAESALPKPLTAVPTDYVIGPEDVLQINVWKNETLSRIVPVRPDGKISLPLLHDVQAAGLTAMQLRDKLALALQEFMPNPEVSVIVSDVRSFRVSVLGEVQKPGVLQLKSDTTVLEALAMSGGFRDFASPSKIVVFRKDSYGKTHKIKFNYNKALSSDDENFTLKTGDVIVVP